MPVVSAMLGGSSNIGIAVYFNSIFGDLSLLKMLLICFCLFVAKFFLGIYKNYLMYGLEWKLRGFWMATIFNIFTLQEYGEFEKIKPGFMVNTITNETLKAASAFRQVLEYFSQVIQFLALSAILLISDFIFTSIALCFVAVMLLFIKYFIVNKTKGFGELRQEREEVVSHEVNELIHGMSTIRAFSLENLLLDRFRNVLAGLIHLMRRTEVLKRLPLQLAEILFVTIALFYVFISQLMNFDMTEQLAFLGVMFVVSIKLFTNAGSLATNYLSISTLWASLTKMSEYMSNPVLFDHVLIREKSKFQKINTVNEIRFSDVSFGYNPNLQVIKQANFRFKNASIISIVGESGCGKSTIGKLLMCFYFPDSGKITINGQPLNEIDIKAWRNLVAYVDQNYFFFNGSILENLVVGLDNYSIKEVNRILRLTYSKSFVDQLPEGLNTFIGDKGNLLSGGQKARLSLARALLRKPKVLILDEVTSALDNVTKQNIAESIETFGKQMMVIMITHDEVLMQKAHHTYRVEDGILHSIS